MFSSQNDNQENLEAKVKSATYKKGSGLFALILIALMIFLIVSFATPLGHQLISNSIFLKVSRTVLSFFLLLFALFKEDKELRFRMVSIILSALFFAFYALSSLLHFGKVFYFISFVFAFISAGSALYFSLLDKKKYVTLILLPVLALVYSMVCVMNIEYASKTSSYLLFPPLIGAGVSFIIALVYLILTKTFVNESKGKAMLTLFVTSLITALFVALGVISINYGLDRSKGREIFFTVIDKYEGEDSDGDPTYRVTFENQDENRRFTLSPSEYEYDTYVLGEEYPFTYYQGALNLPYYIEKEFD